MLVGDKTGRRTVPVILADPSLDIRRKIIKGLNVREYLENIKFFFLPFFLFFFFFYYTFILFFYFIQSSNENILSQFPVIFYDSPLSRIRVFSRALFPILFMRVHARRSRFFMVFLILAYYLCLALSLSVFSPLRISLIFPF